MSHGLLSIVHDQPTMLGMIDLGRLVKQAREQAGYRTQREFAEAWGKEPSYVSRLENGVVKEMLSADDVRRLVAIAPVSASDLLEAAGYPIDRRSNDPRTAAVRRFQPLIDQIQWTPGKRQAVEGLLRLLADPEEFTRPTRERIGAEEE